MTPLESRLCDTIARDGPITVGQYMAAALSDPEHGYYPTRDPLGAAGDFVTAPEISQLFGEMIGLWCAVTWRQMGSPDPVRLVELGPGRGTLMADALRAARTAPDFAAALDIHLVETSPVLRRRQEAVLRYAGAAKITFHRGCGDVPRGPTLIVANEFFDALPVEQAVRGTDGWQQILVGLAPSGSGLAFQRADAAAPPDGLPEALKSAEIGHICEFSPARNALAAEIASQLAADGGAALIVDYGPARTAPGDTLQAVRRHAFAEPLARPGGDDLTAHVDFEALAAAGTAAGARAFGPLPQGTFLNRLGIAVRALRLAAATQDADKSAEIMAGWKRLTDPSAMGTLFKALVLADPALPPPAGFEPEPPEGTPSC